MKIFSKENQRTELNKDNMNLKDIVKPTFGVGIIDGNEVNRGPTYSQKKNDGRLTMKEYKEKFERIDILHRGL